MTEPEWLASTDPAAMLRWLTHWTHRDSTADTPYWPHPVCTDRKLRLFACACCRQVWDKLTDPRSRRAVEVAERFADGRVTNESRLAAERGVPSGISFDAADWLAHAACGLSSSSEAAWEMVRVPRPALIPPATQAALLHDIFGNPWRPTAPENACGTGEAADWYQVLAWHDGTVPRIAQYIYDERAWQDMPILHDALLDAGCDDEEILNHCRGQERCGDGWQRNGRCYQFQKYGTDWEKKIPCNKCDGTGRRPLSGPHVRGCWVLDLILGRE